MATICCARMSRAFSGMLRRSSSPLRIARTSAAHSINSLRVVAKDAALGNRAVPVARAADALPGHGDRARRSDLANQVHRADVDSEFQRGRGHQRPHFARLQFSLGLQPQLARQASVMRGHRVVPQSLAPGDEPRVRRGDGYSQRAARSDAARRAAPAGRKFHPTFHAWRRRPARCAELPRRGRCVR